jgi:radical SAM superfamily enzyme YgiQ (UPF0313 family)
MTDLLFGQSYYLKFDPKLYAAMQPYPPLGTLFAASFMREQGYKVALFDAMLAESEQEWDAALERYQPRYAVIYEDNFNYLSKMCLLNMREAAFKMTAMAKARGIPVIICGSDASDHYEAYLQNGADYVIRGEGEETLQELLASLTGKSDKPLDEIAGLAYEDVATLPRPVMKQLDTLPFPAWDLVDVERYRSIWMERHGYYSVNMVTTRGCPYHCNWCAKPIWGQRYNVRSAENVVRELIWLRENFQPDHIWFADDILGLKPGWVQEFANLVEKYDVRTPFKCLSRADLLLVDDTIEAMKRAGADIIWMGAESGSQKILDAMDKGTKVEQIYEATRKLKAIGVKVGFFLQFGYPGENREDIQKTVQMVRDLMPNDIGISVSYPLPGTKFFNSVKADLTVTNWQDSADLAMLYAGPYPTEFYRQLHKVVHKDYRSRKTWQALRRGHIRHPRQIAAMIYHRLSLPLAQSKLDSLARLPHRPTQLLPEN